MSEHKHYKIEVVKVPKKWKAKAFIDKDEYGKLYRKSVDKPDKFWGKQGKRLDWIKPYTKVKNTSFAYPQCLDQMVRGRHAQRRRQLHRPAPEEARQADRDHLGAGRSLRRSQAHHLPRAARASLPARQCAEGATASSSGDRVTIYLPMIPEAAYAMLACARIGAVHSVVFGGFSPDSLAGRIDDCNSNFVITADEGLRGGTQGPAQGQRRRGARQGRAASSKVIVVRRTGAQVPGRRAATSGTTRSSPRSATIASREEMNAEDPLFILYTSGSTGKPEGRAAHHRRLSGLRGDDPSICLRLP